MVAIAALDGKVNVAMFFEAMGGRLKKLLASTMTPEEKLAQIVKDLTAQVYEKKKLATTIGARMRAIEDPETQNLEPLEALRARREKLVRLGATLVDQPGKEAQLGQISQEIKSLDAQIKSQESTYATLKESYELARASYKQALSALETVRDNGSAILAAIEASKQALALRDKANSQDVVDTSFIDQLQGELSQAQAELRSDEEIDKDLDATDSFSVDAALSQMDAASVDSDLMAEFQAAKKK